MCSLTTPTKNVDGSLQTKRHQIKLNIKDNQPGVFNLADSDSSKVSDARIEIIWQNPRQPLTLVIVTPYTEKQEAFLVHLINPADGSLSKAYRIIDETEVELSSDDRFWKMQSDSNYEVVLKFIPTVGKTDEVLLSYVIAAA